jgi:hypothetical protein
VAQCPASRTLLDRLREPAPPVDDLAWARAERSLARRPGPWRARRLPWAAATAGLVAAAAIAVWLVRPAPDEPSSTVRSGPGIQLLAPSGTAAELELRWKAPAIYDRFLLELAGAEGTVTSIEVRSPPHRLDARGLGAQRWRITAVAPDGRALDRSAWMELELPPRAPAPEEQ